MAKYVIKEYSDDPITVTESNSTWVIAKTGTLATNLDSIGENSAYHGNTFRVNGTVSASVGFSSLDLAGYDSRVLIGKSGVSSRIDAEGDQAFVENRGRITSMAGYNAVSLYGESATFVNFGFVTGSLDIRGDEASVENHGRITALPGYSGGSLGGQSATFDNFGTAIGSFYFRHHVFNHEGAVFRGDGSGRSVALSDGAIAPRLVNEGAIIAFTPGSLAVEGGDGADVIINRGRIVGHVNMYEGNDRFVGAGGTLRGDLNGGDGDDRIDLRHATTLKNGDFTVSLHGGAGHDTIDLRSAKLFSDTVIWGDSGDDTFLVDRKIVVNEVAAEGIDLVKSSVSYDLSANYNVENLTLLGKKNIAALGNDTRNILTGNAGDNVLRGRAGADDIYGGRGDDLLFGGPDGDIFVFRTGYGHDVIEDFSRPDNDLIALNDWNAIADFTDLMNNHASNHGGDVWITAGNDRLIIRDIQQSELEIDDFYI